MDIGLDGWMDLETAARALEVHYQTAYRWVRTGVLPAVKVGSEYRLSLTDVEALVCARRASLPPSYTGRRRDWDRLGHQLDEALMAGDETGARRLFERIRLGRVPLLEQCERLIAPTIQRVGERCGDDSRSRARLALAAGIVERCLALAMGRTSSGSRALALVARPDGERHRLPALMAAAVLREDGWAVRQVGDLPADEIVEFARRTRPAIAVVSTAQSDRLDAASALQARLQGDAGLPVLVGRPGQALGELAQDATTIGIRLWR